MMNAQQHWVDQYYFDDLLLDNQLDLLHRLIAKTTADVTNKTFYDMYRHHLHYFFPIW